MNRTKLIVIADDLTGANDTGVQFSKRGLNVFVTSEIDESALKKELENYDVLVVNTESRFLPTGEAYEELLQLGFFIKQNYKGKVYKKIDSTYRGNIATEIEALKSSLELNKVIIGSAFPKVGRSVKNGSVYVNDIILEKTSFSQDPKNPMKKSFIPEILNLKNYSIHCSENLESFTPSSEYIIFDGSGDKELMEVAKFLETLDEDHLVVGTGGLAEYLKLNIENKINLFFSGSANEVTHSQLKELLKEKSVNSFAINHEKLGSEDQEIISEILCSIKNSILDSKDFLLYVAFENSNGVTSAERDIASKNIMDFYKKISKIIINENFNNIQNLFITGGDTAINILNANGINGINIKGEIESGIPFGKIQHSMKDFTLVTKAGGFGKENSLVNVLNFFKNSNYY